MAERVTIRDIAEELGLSTATVSNVIHGKPGKVSDETVRRVQTALEERGYIPSMAGILLARNSSRIIGVFLNDHEKYGGHTLSDPFIASSLDHLSTEIEAAGQFMMVKKAKDPTEIIQFASMWNMEGLIVIGFCRQDYTYLREHMRIPFVVYDGICGKTERIANLTIDNFDGGRQVGEYFRKLGHRRALCVTDNQEGIDLQRLEGFRAGFAPGQWETLRVPMEPAARWAYYRQSLPLLRGVTAVFAVSDFYAMDLMRFLTEQGISVPADLSVAGFDDIPLCTLVSPALTTVHQDGALRARLAMERLRALTIGQDAGNCVTLPVTLVTRDSCRKL